MSWRRACAAVGALLVVSGLVHAGVLLVTGGAWSGPVSWRKPATFGVSFGLTVLTFVWLAQWLPPGRAAGPDRGAWLLGLLTGASVLEVGLITVQAWRRVPSHFDLQTPFDATVARLLALGGAVLIGVIGWFTVAAFRSAPAVPPSTRLALRAGLLVLDVSLLTGVAMIVAGTLRVAAGDQAGAYTTGGFLKSAHFVTMHGVLALPVLARLLTRTALAERDRVRLVALAVAGYAVLCGVVGVDAVAGNPLFGPGSVTVAGAGVLAVAVAAVLTLRAVARSARPGPRTPPAGPGPARSA